MGPRAEHAERRYQTGALTVVVRHDADGTATIALHGDADLHSSSALTEAIAGLLVTSCRRVEVDLTDLDFIDSCGVRALLIGDHILGANVLVSLLHAPPNIRRVLDVLRLDEVFEIR